MSRANVSRLRSAAAAVLLASMLCSCRHALAPKDDPGCAGPDCATRAHVCDTPTVHALAHDLDHLETHIEWYGSVVPKVPDVWGQARLTQHREEFEERMRVELDTFGVKLNGNLARADEAFFAQSLALGAAARPRPERSLSGSREVIQSYDNSVKNVVDTTVKTETKTTDPAKTVTDTLTNKADGMGQVKGSVTDKTTFASATPPAVPKAEDLLVDLTPGKDLGPEIEKNRIGFAALKAAGIGLEPTVMLEQKARYLNLLNQIRRTNEGDDTADAPGYSLNLIRIPVSVLPGHRTRTGHGAEITFTINPVLSDELLPTTYRTLIVNDLMKQFSFPLARFLEDREERENLNDENRAAVREIADGKEKLTNAAKITTSKATQRILTVPDSKYETIDVADARAQLEAGFKNRALIPSLPPAQGRLSRTSVPNSQLLDVYGLEYCFEIAFQARRVFEDKLTVNGYAHVPDVQSYLQSELNAAYRFLAEPANQTLWADYCRPEIVTAVRNRNVVALAESRTSFRTYFKGVSETQKPKPKEAMEFSVTAALAWAILVDAALLTDRLIQDMRETAAAKGCAPFCAGWLDFAAPHPSPEARRAFNEYVKCRWPIRVFALDPATQEQNLGDTLSTRRETQLALSLAFVSGQINARSLTRYARRLEAEYETIALNRTQVGFSHGENTFGWRFYPRFQTPETEPNLTVLVRDQLIGGPSQNALLRQRRLEPGPRECVAVVIMPSFVPYVTCDSVSNWFGLADPKHKAFDLTQAMRVSRAVKALQTCGPNVRDAGCYRDGDFARLLRRVEQLDARMPTQTQTVQVPVVNTLGGFEMFNNGTTDLAPELYGFYGAPGARTDDLTTLFLVGDHFSPLRTKVIVGNKECRTEMLSRQVVKVTVPPQALPTNDNVVHAHLATPYGVSREIAIPLARPIGKPAAEFAVDLPNWTLDYRPVPLLTDPTNKNLVVGHKYEFLGSSAPTTARLHWRGVPADKPAQVDLTLTFTANGAAVVVKVPTTATADGGFALAVDEAFLALLEKVNADVAKKPAAERLRLGPLVVVAVDAKNAKGEPIAPRPTLATAVEVRAVPAAR